MTNTPTLGLPVEVKHFIVYCEASNFCMDFMLMQDKKVIAYALWQLKVNQRSYPTHDLKLVAVVFAIMIWLRYLYDIKREAFTDHRSLQHLFSQKDINLRQYVWLSYVKIMMSPSNTIRASSMLWRTLSVEKWWVWVVLLAWVYPRDVWPNKLRPWILNSCNSS